MLIEITDFASPELDVYARLTEVQLRNVKNAAQGVFIAESATAVRLALDAKFEPLSLLIEKSRLEREGGEIVRRVGEISPLISVYTASDDILTGLTGFKLTRGVLCAMRRKPLPSSDELLKNASRVAVFENVADSTNVGALFRSAAAFGIDAVLVTEGCCDPLCRRSIRVSMGTIFQIPWTRVGGDYVGYLHNLGFKTVSMALTDNSTGIDDPRIAASDKLAVILGAEGGGLSPQTIAKSDFIAKIPMSNGVDSLNVAAAGAVIFWQLRRC